MSNEKLEDFGEHIAGAKKETYFRAINPTSEEAKKLPLSKLWTDKDIKAIDDIQISAIAHTLKANLPNKPRQSHKVSTWLHDLYNHQETVAKLIESNNSELTTNFLEKMQQGQKAYLLTQLDYADWKRIGAVFLYQRTNAGNAVHLEVEIDKQSYFFEPKTPVFLEGLDDKAFIDAFASEIKSKLKEQEKGEKSKNSLTASSFDIYTRRRDGTAFICYKNDRQKTPLIEFATLSEAREYKKDPENIVELSRRWTAHREQNSITKADMRNAVNEERTGQSYRDHDITPDEFMATFGIRGGQFGNWVTGDERQQMLNNAYDGFMDLSKALKINPKAIGLNGTLGIAFGARGSGWASAHYERGEQVINLTKTRGAGSLAHEWWHSLDHYMKNGNDLLTRHLKADSTARYQELVLPVRELVKGIHKLELYSRSQKADTYRSQPYFETDVEMTARAFEGYIQYTLSTMEIENDFLVNIKAEKDWQKNLDAYPYPKAEELEPLGKAYNAVFDTLKEVDKEFAPVNYEPEQIIHADTLAVTEAEKTTEEQPFALDIYLQNNRFTQDIHGIWHRAISGYKENLMVYGYPNNSLDISLGDNRSTLIAKLDKNISIEEIHQTFAESWYSDLVEWRLENQKTQEDLDLEQEHEKQPLNITDEPQAQTTSETTSTQQLLLSATNRILLKTYLENNGFKKGINVGSYRKQIDDNNLLVVGIANDLSIKSIVDNKVKEQETVLSSLAQNLGEDDIKQAFSQLKLWQQATTPTPNISQYDTKLNTPYAEKNQAKALGAKWDSNNKTWYVPAGLDLDKFSKWLPEHQVKKNEKIPSQSQRIIFIQPSDRIYLYTQPSDNPAIQELKEKDIVKFDTQNKVWFAHKDNAESVKQWITRPFVPTPEQELTKHLQSLGITVAEGHPIFDDKPHRLANNGSTDKNVMYQAYANNHNNGIPFARITNFSRNGVSNWIYPVEHLNNLRSIQAVDRAMGKVRQTSQRPSPQQEQIRQSQFCTATQKDKEKITLENKMAERAKMLMSFAPIAPNNQHYLNKKQVTANNIARIVPSSDHIPKDLEPYIAIGNTPKQFYWLQANNPDNKLVIQRGNLIIPQVNAQGEIRAFETIAYNGKKYAQKEAEKTGLFTQLGNIKDGDPIIITEGYATGATLYEHTGRAVVVAFGKNGLMDISQELRKKYPNSKIYIGADNDHDKEQNFGLINAVAVQQRVDNVYILVPKFEQGEAGKDWNDLYVNKGVETLKQELKSQLSKINLQREIPQQYNISKHHLDPDMLRQAYPTMSKENIQAVQIWRQEIINRYSDDLERQEATLKRLTNKLPDFANGEQLPLPKSKSLEKKPPVNEMVSSNQLQSTQYQEQITQQGNEKQW